MSQSSLEPDSMLTACCQLRNLTNCIHRRGGSSCSVNECDISDADKLATAPSPLLSKSSRKRKNANPVLFDILESTSEESPFVVTFNATEMPKNNNNTAAYSKQKRTTISSIIPDRSRHRGLSNLIDFRVELDPPSSNYDDYFEIDDYSPSIHYTPDNSLFLSLARALLYKIYHVDRKYEFMLRRIYLLRVDDHFEFTSDLTLQELLRHNLCLYWLSHVVDGQFKPDCTYSKEFPNVLDFLYQVYQISVNNFANNRLFANHAVSDLVEILKVKLFVFDKTDKKRVPRCHEPANPYNLRLNDFIYLNSLTDIDGVKYYRWMMPNQKRSTLCSPHNNTLTFLRAPSVSHSAYKIVIDRSELYKRFTQTTLVELPCITLFLRFLSETPVHTLITVKEISCQAFLDTNRVLDLIDYLNQIWGQTHFSLEKLSKEINTISKGLSAYYKLKSNERLPHHTEQVRFYTEEEDVESVVTLKHPRDSIKSSSESFSSSSSSLHHPASAFHRVSWPATNATTSYHHLHHHQATSSLTSAICDLNTNIMTNLKLISSKESRLAANDDDEPLDLINYVHKKEMAILMGHDEQENDSTVVLNRRKDCNESSRRSLSSCLDSLHNYSNVRRSDDDQVAN